MAEHHRGAAGVHVRRRGVTSKAERHRDAARTTADVGEGQWQSTTVVPPTYEYAVLARAPRRNTTVAPPRHPCASLAMVFPLRQYSRCHGEDYTRRSTNLRDTSCKGDVTSAVLTASCVIGDTRRLGRPPGASGRAPLWCRQHARPPSWRDLQGRAPPWRRPNSGAPTWCQLSDRAPPWCRQRTHAPSWRNLQGRAPPWCRPDNHAPTWRKLSDRAPLWCRRRHMRRRGATCRAERHRGAARTTTRQHGASSVAEHHCGAADVCVRRHNATVAAPGQPCAHMALTRW